jgi:prokaryotic ubiquitin-like protein Pup
MIQKQKQISRPAKSRPEEPPQDTPNSADDKMDTDIEGLLDEIDEVLEKNADAFVKGYVQKGGE